VQKWIYTDPFGETKVHWMPEEIMGYIEFLEAEVEMLELERNDWRARIFTTLS
jgi:hypothetical protein